MRLFDTDEPSLSSLDDDTTSDGSDVDYHMRSTSTSSTSVVPRTSSDGDHHSRHTPRPPTPWSHRLQQQRELQGTPQPPRRSSARESSYRLHAEEEFARGTTQTGPDASRATPQAGGVTAVGGPAIGAVGAGGTRDVIMGDEDIMRHILPFVLGGAAITVVDGNTVQRFAPPTPPQQGASMALHANYRAAMHVFLEVLQVHILSSLLNELLRNAEPHYEEAPLKDEALTHLQRRVLTSALRAGFASHDCDSRCTVCLESFAVKASDDDSDDDKAENEGAHEQPGLSSSPSAEGGPARRREDQTLLMPSAETGSSTWNCTPASAASSMSSSSWVHVHKPSTRASAQDLSGPMFSDTEAVLAAAERSGKRVVCRLPCNHFFCYECVKQWFAQTGTCPNCRTPVRPLDVLYAKNPAPSWWTGGGPARASLCAASPTADGPQCTPDSDVVCARDTRLFPDASSFTLLPQGLAERLSTSLSVVGPEAYETMTGSAEADLYNAMYQRAVDVTPDVLPPLPHTTAPTTPPGTPRRERPVPSAIHDSSVTAAPTTSNARLRSIEVPVTSPTPERHVSGHLNSLSSATIISVPSAAATTTPPTRRMVPLSPSPSLSRLPALVPRPPSSPARASVAPRRFNGTIVPTRALPSMSVGRPAPTPSPFSFPLVQSQPHGSSGRRMGRQRSRGTGEDGSQRASGVGDHSHSTAMGPDGRRHNGHVVAPPADRRSHPLSPPASPSTSLFM